MTLFRTVGETVDVAVFGSLHNNSLASTGSLPPGSASYLSAFTHGIDLVFVSGAIAGLLVLIATLAVVEVPLRSSHRAATAPHRPLSPTNS